MKRITKGLGQLKKVALAATIVLSLNTTSYAQSCLTSSLDFSSGNDISSTPAVVSSGNPDPKWTLTTTSTVYGPITTPQPAMVVTPVGTWNTGYGQWLSTSQTDANGITCTTNEHIVFSRDLNFCQGGDFDFNFDMLFDNYITDVTITEVATSTPHNLYSAAPPGTWSTTSYTTPTNVSGSLSLPAGVYRVDITLGNFGVPNSNPVGISIDATVTESNGLPVIVNDLSPDCQDYECSECSDLCYWKVEGNTIQNGKNLFGTLSSNSVEIITENHLRGILTPGGDNSSDMTAGRLGWNTMIPTARLHVDCMFGNEDWSGVSDIRFENLEHGEGEVLVISPEGYVFNSSVQLSDIAGMAGMIAEQQETIQQLQQKVAALEGVATGISNTSKTDNSSIAQNIPNPFNGQTTISYYVASMNKDAFVAIYDLNGKQLNKFHVQTTGKGEVSINGGDMPAGMYLYSLVIDGEIIDSKRMVLSK